VNRGPRLRQQALHPQTALFRAKRAPVSPLFATLTNFAPRNSLCLPLLRKRRGCTQSLPKTELLPLATPNSSLAPIPFTIRTYKKQAYNPCRICTSKTKNLKLRRINTYKKNQGVGVLLLTRYPTKGICPERPSGAKDLICSNATHESRTTSHNSQTTSHFLTPPFSYTIPPQHPRRPHEL